MFLRESFLKSRTMCVRCHLESVEEPRKGGPRMTDETGDTWRRTRTVDIKMQHMRKLCAKRKSEGNTSNFSFILRPDWYSRRTEQQTSTGEHR